VFHKRDKGFTYTELVITLMIIGILTVVAIPAITGLFSFGLDSVALQITSDIRYAQSLSISYPGLYSVDFSPANGYQVLDPGGSVVTDPANMAVGRTIDLSLPRYQGLVLSSADFDGTDQVYFDSLGTPYQADGVTGLVLAGSVTLTDKDGASRTISVQPGTGKVSIQ